MSRGSMPPPPTNISGIDRRSGLRARFEGSAGSSRLPPHSGMSTKTMIGGGAAAIASASGSGGLARRLATAGGGIGDRRTRWVLPAAARPAPGLTAPRGRATACLPLRADAAKPSMRALGLELQEPHPSLEQQAPLAFAAMKRRRSRPGRVLAKAGGLVAPQRRQLHLQVELPALGDGC